MKSIFRILRSTSVLWPYYLGIIACAVLVAGTTLVTPFIVREATDTIVATLGEDSADTTTTVATTVVWFAVALLVAALLQTLLENIGGYLGDVMSARMREILSTRYFAQLLSLPQRYFDDQFTGTIIARLERSITNITQFLQSFSNNFFPMLLTIAAVLAITGWHYWPLAVLLALVFPVYTWLTALTSRRWQRIEAHKNAHVDAAGGRFAEVIGQIKVARSFNSETREATSFGRHYHDTVQLTRQQSNWWHRMDGIRGSVLAVIFAGIFLLIFLRTLDGSFTIGTMFMLIQLVNMARQPVTMMSYLIDTAQRAIAGSRDYFRVMELEPEACASSDLVALSRTNGQITEKPLPPSAPTRHVSPDTPAVSFTDVSFAYEPGNEVLHQVSFSVAQGEKLAFVG